MKVDGIVNQVSNFSRLVKYNNCDIFDFIYLLEKSPLLIPDFIGGRDVRTLVTNCGIIGFHVLRNEICGVGPKSTVPRPTSTLTLFSQLPPSMHHLEKYRDPKRRGTEINWKSWKEILLRFFGIVYSNYLGVRSAHGKTYLQLSNAQLSELTGYPKSLWELLGKGSALLCVLDLKAISMIFNNVRGEERDLDSKFSKKDRKEIKGQCRTELIKLMKKAQFKNFFQSLM